MQYKHMLLVFLILQINSLIVQIKDQCNKCELLKSELDCFQANLGEKCNWIKENGIGKCQTKIPIQTEIFSTYCQQIDTLKCSTTLSCAFNDGKCTDFQGCSAYFRITNNECQSISNQCISNGSACIYIKECSQYTKKYCSQAPSKSGLKQCKWNDETSVCRDYVCQDADNQINTDKECNSYLTGCVTNLKGCWTFPLPNCSSFSRNGDCNYRGADGYCEDAQNSDYCKAKDCENSTKYSTNEECQEYQIGCVTNGKGCIKANKLQQCQSYFGNHITCVGYIGSDGICEGDIEKVNCRARKCINASFTTDKECKQYHSSCVTNGRGCTTGIEYCEQYRGTKTTCELYIALNGYCEGYLINSDDFCRAKVCEYAPTNLRTNEECNKYQIGCVTTGFGCVKKANLKSCTTYDGDDISCQTRIGLDGNCTWKDGDKCIARICVDAPITYKSNNECAEWQLGCVTNGYGCIESTTCNLINKQISCIGIQNCGWQSICVDNMKCSDIKEQQNCIRFQNNQFKQNENGKFIYTTQKCIWKNEFCKDLECSDLKGKQFNNDYNCEIELSGCISNTVDRCRTKYDCDSLFGTQQKCLNYPGYCTNSVDATDDYPCLSRTCYDNIIVVDNQQCEEYLPGCIFNINRCLKYDSPCYSFQGTQEICNNIYGYVRGTYPNYETQQCYNYQSDQSYCQVKRCELAVGMQSDDECQVFMSKVKCVYDGNGSCVDPKTATCSSYKGDSTFCEKVSVKCFGSGGQCKQRECTDNTTAQNDSECEMFMSGCIVKSETNGCISISQRTCQQQIGTTITCSNFSGGVQIGESADYDKVQCVKYDECVDKECIDLKNPQTQQDCINYKSSCRFLQLGQTCINHNVCNLYSLPSIAITDQQKFDYCISITDHNNKFCGYNNGSNNCSDRSCDQVNNKNISIKPNCLTYTSGCKITETFCYTLANSCSSYNLPNFGIDDKQKQLICNRAININSQNCSYIIGQQTCVDQNTCETIISPIDARFCNDYLNTNGICQKTQFTGCITTSVTCGDYKIDITLSDLIKKQICESLKIIDNINNFGQGNAIYKSCIWKNGQTCSSISSCEDIPKADSQMDCDKQFQICHFFGGLCYSGLNYCSDIYIPNNLSDLQKSLFCNSMYSNINGSYCTLNFDKTQCVDNNSDCNFYIPGVAINPQEYCYGKTDWTKTIQCIVAPNDNQKCQNGECSDIKDAKNQGDCDNHILRCVYHNGKCWNSKVDWGGALECSYTSKVEFDGTLIQFNERTEYCQKHRALQDQYYCTYEEYNFEPLNQCVQGQNCDQYLFLPQDIQDKINYCKRKLDKYGYKCSYSIGESACRDFNCQDTTNVTSQIDCDIEVPRQKCKYYKGTCYNLDFQCDQIVVQSNDNDKKKYCEGLILNNNNECTYINGDYCINRNECQGYDVLSIPQSNRKYICDNLQGLTTKCTYIWGNKCIQLNSCYNYDGTVFPNLGPQIGQEDIQCRTLFDDQSKPCIMDSMLKCRYQLCEDNDINQIGCNKLLNCQYYNGKCFNKSECTEYLFQTEPNEMKKIWCEALFNNEGNKCKWDSDNFLCIDRQCSDVKYYTDFDCQNYLKTCKTDGYKCVDITQQCNNFKGTQQFCEKISDSTGNDKCLLSNISDTTSSSCQSKTCYDNVTATSDSECELFLSGCITRGIGCIPNNQPCTSYRGIKEVCETFKQQIGLDQFNNPIYQYCSGNIENKTTDICRIRTCFDNITATDNATCESYLKGCITNGNGCIHSSAPCSSYKGNLLTCAKFRGENGQKSCWGMTDVIGNCITKMCYHIQGTNNAACNEGMISSSTHLNPTPQCIFDGNRCVENNKLCKSFIGNEITCQTFIAIDGPCKSTNFNLCTKRVCTEAPSTYTTDEECQQYHPECYTTGQGCTSNKSCSSLINQNQCISRKECSWISQCYKQSNTCSTYSKTSYTECVNSRQIDGTICFWTESSQECHTQTCEDLPETYSTHEQCQEFSSKCTTTGQGCITITNCDKYNDKSICLAVFGDGRCLWENNICRNRVCTDIYKETDDECIIYGCKTNGVYCISGDYCRDFIKQKYCLQSNSGPCLWINGSCHNDNKCEDAYMKTHEECKQLSNNCTSNGINCIPIDSCEFRTTKAACQVGTEGICGWLPSGKCQQFSQCSDVIGKNNDDCQSYGSNCITDGTTCIEISKCSEYKTLVACGSKGTDGICFWNSNTEKCKLKECTDFYLTTHEVCQQLNVSNSITCTSNGVNCIRMQNCENYSENDCLKGTNGDCIYATDIHGGKSCRTLQCEDIKSGQNKQKCQGFINGKYCYLNGESCVSNPPCSIYRDEVQCKNIGFKGDIAVICAFFPRSESDQQNGTCKIFESCADANYDQQACLSNLSCKWTSKDGKTSCDSHTCLTYAFGIDCQPVPSFDNKLFTICVLQNGYCEEGNPEIQITNEQCYTQSAFTHSWNQYTKKCERCFAQSSSNEEENQTQFGYILQFLFYFGYQGFFLM